MKLPMCLACKHPYLWFGKTILCKLFFVMQKFMKNCADSDQSATPVFYPSSGQRTGQAHDIYPHIFTAVSYLQL